MKKILAIVLMGMLTFSLGACESAQEADSKEVETDVEVDETVNVIEDSANTLEGGAEGELSFVGFKVYEPSDSGYTNYDILVKNETGETINTVSADVQYLDDSNSIIDTSYPQIPVRVLSGQTLAIDGLIETGKADYLTVTGYSFYTESGDYVSGQFEQIPTAAPLNESGDYFEEEESYFENNAIAGPIMTNDIGNLTVESLEIGEVSGDYIHFYANVVNDTDDNIHTLTVRFTFIDEKGNISGATYPQEAAVVQPGQKIRMEGLVKTSDAEYVTVDGYSYYNSSDEYFSGFFGEIPQAISLNSDEITTSDDATTEEKENSENNNGDAVWKEE